MNRKNSNIRFLLLPVALLYSLVVWLRNLLFDWKILPSKKFPVPVICIGNISVGGTGKTPFTEYLIMLLKKQYRVAMLSRGYKRKTKGFILANENCTADEIGDEACQIKQKFPDIIVAVDANRCRGIKRLLALPANKKPNVILLDDAMQHRYVTPSLTIMLTDYNNMFYEDYFLPVGDLREPAGSVSRADLIVVTKCKGVIKPIDLRIIEKNMTLMASQSLYFSEVKYHQMKALFPLKALNPCVLDEHVGDENILLIAGIANPQYLIDKLGHYFKNIQKFIFPDHHDFTQQDIEKIDSKFRTTPSPRRIICTEKDAMRLKNLDFLPKEWASNLYYLPISVGFLFERGESFDSKILKHVISTINIYKKNVKN
jgi:tetraacyldisaccharide 4''-kinase